MYKIGGELIQARLEKGLPHDSVSKSVYLMAVVVSTILLTLGSSLDIFSELSAEAGPHANSPEEALLIALVAGVFILAAHTAVALVITWFIYKRSDPSPRILYIMFSIFRIHILTTAFLQASLNDAIARTAVETTQPAVSLYKK